MDWEWDAREQGQLGTAHRSHMREMNAARQAAERLRAVRSADPEVRRASEEAFKQEMARIDAEHRAWLRDHAALK